MNNAMKRYPLSTNVDTVKKFEDLFLFGYQSTIFNDDEKALFIDQGKHLIPWMGDEALMIDRYDGRGHLSDLTTYDADLTKGRWQPLNDREKQIEAMLDEERYYELNNDVHEKMLYEEEELKRLSEALADNSYAAVAFSYDDDQRQEGQEAASVKVENAAEERAEVEEEDNFTMPSNLNISPDIPIPTSMRQYSVIERTAMFVSKQGSQMEIVIKTKQKDNPAFQFLDFTNPLYLFYKHLVELVKSGKFIPNVSKERVAKQSDMVQEFHKEDQISSMDFLQSIQEKLPAGQIANTPYARLLSNLAKLAPKPTISAPQSATDEVDSTAVTVLTPPPPPPSEEEKESTDEEDFIYRDSPKNELMEMSEIIPPPPDQQPIIDKMAEYVVRNGPEFEQLVRMKNDKRFAFLDVGHQFHNYYVYKKQIYAQKKEDAKNRAVALEVMTRRTEEEDGSNEMPTNGEAKSTKLVDYESNESSQLLVSYNSDSGGSDYGDDKNAYGVVTTRKLVDYEPDESVNKKSGDFYLVDHVSNIDDDDVDKRVKMLVHYDDEGNDDNDIDSNDVKLKARLKSLVPSYRIEEREDDRDKYAKKKKKRKRSRVKLYGPSLPGEMDSRKLKREKIFGPNLPEHFDERIDSPSKVQDLKMNDENINAANLIEASTSNIILNGVIIGGEDIFLPHTHQHISAANATTAADDLSLYKIDKKRKKIYGPELPDYMISNSRNFEDSIDDVGIDNDIKIKESANPEFIANDNLDSLRSDVVMADVPDHKQQRENRKTKRQKMFGRHFKKHADASRPFSANSSDPATPNFDYSNDISNSVSDNQADICSSDFSIDPSATFLPASMSLFKTKAINSSQLPSIDESARQTTSSTSDHLRSNEEGEACVNKITADLSLLNPTSSSTDLTDLYSSDPIPTNNEQLIAPASNCDFASNADDNTDDDDDDDVDDGVDDDDNDDDENEVNDKTLEAGVELKDDVIALNPKNDNDSNNYDNLSNSIGQSTSSDNSGNPDGGDFPDKLIRKRKDSEDRKKMLKSISFTIKTKLREDEVPKVRQNIFKNVLSSEAEDESEKGEEECDEVGRTDCQHYVEQPMKIQTTVLRQDRSVVLERGPVIYKNMAPEKQWEGNEFGGNGGTMGDIWGGQVVVNQPGVYGGWVGVPDGGSGFQNVWSQTFQEKTYNVPIYPKNDASIFDVYRTESPATANVEVDSELKSKLVNRQFDGVFQSFDNNLLPTNDTKNNPQLNPIALNTLDSTSLQRPTSASLHQEPSASSSFVASSLPKSSQPASPITILSEARISPLPRKSRNPSKSGSKSPQHRHKKSGKSGHKKKKKHKKDGSSKHSRKHKCESPPPQPHLKRYLREEDVEERMRVLNEAIERRVLQEEREKRRRKRRREKKRRKSEMDSKIYSSDDDGEVKKKKTGGMNPAEEIMVDLTLLSNSDDGSSSDVIIQEIIEP